MVAGGGNIGLRPARALERDYSVRLIEHNKRRCEFLATKLNQALVLNGDATDEELLEQENIGQMGRVRAGATSGAVGGGGEVLMAHHDTVIEAEDHVIVFVTDKKTLPRVEKLFQVG